MAPTAPSHGSHTEDQLMSVGRITKIVAAVIGVSSPVLLVSLGLAAWVLGEAA